MGGGSAGTVEESQEREAPVRGPVGRWWVRGVRMKSVQSELLELLCGLLLLPLIANVEGPGLRPWASSLVCTHLETSSDLVALTTSYALKTYLSLAYLPFISPELQVRISSLFSGIE